MNNALVIEYYNEDRNVCKKVFAHPKETLKRMQFIKDNFHNNKYKLINSYYI